MHSNQTNLYSKFIRYVHIRENSNLLITAYANTVQPHQHIPPYVYIYLSRYMSWQKFGSIMFVVRCDGLIWHMMTIQILCRKSFEQMVCFYAYVRVVDVFFAYSACTIHMPHIYFYEISLLNSITHTRSSKSEVFFVSFTDEADSGDDHSDRGRSHTPEQENHHQEERPLALNLVRLYHLRI